jgi:hypothetical protein
MKGFTLIAVIAASLFFSACGGGSAGSPPPPPNNSKTWTWMNGSKFVNQVGTYGTVGMPSVSNVPGAREGAFSWTDASGNFWLFGGSGSDSVLPGAGPLNDLWKYSSGQWTWVSGSNLAGQSGAYGTQGIASPGNVPGARTQGAAWIDASDNLWLFGGYDFDGAENFGLLNDL